MSRGLQRSLVLDSITHLKPGAGDRVVIAGSHCGVYCARYALNAGVAAVVLHDAGVGRDEAGIGGLVIFGEAGIPAATVGHASARIGDGADCLARGEISHCNGAAYALGVAIGMRADAAVALLGRSAVHRPATVGGEVLEARHPVEVADARRPVIVVDSASLLTEGDEGAVAVTGSHGGLLGGRVETAIKTAAFAAVFNDAGVGIEAAGISRLAPLDSRDIAAVAVDVWTARIGDGLSTLEDGVISHVNDRAANIGARPGMPARTFVEIAARA